MAELATACCGSVAIVVLVVFLIAMNEIQKSQ